MTTARIDPLFKPAACFVDAMIGAAVLIFIHVGRGLFFPFPEDGFFAVFLQLFFGLEFILGEDDLKGLRG